MSNKRGLLLTFICAAGCIVALWLSWPGAQRNEVQSDAKVSGSELGGSPSASTAAVTTGALLTAKVHRRSEGAEPPETDTRDTAGTEEVPPWSRAALGADATINRIKIRIAAYEDGSEEKRALRFLVSQFEQARNWVNPHLRENFEGTTFGYLFAPSAKKARWIANAWAITLEELGCTITETKRTSLEKMVESLLVAHAEIAKSVAAAGFDDAGEAAAALDEMRQDLFESMMMELKGILAEHEYGSVSEFMRGVNLEPTTGD